MTAAGSDLAELARTIADAVRECGREGFVPALVAMLRAIVAADDIMIVIYRPGQPPELVHDQSAGPQGQTNLALYLKGAWLLDPFYRAIAEGTPPGCYRLKQLAPSAFRSSEYYRLHFARTGIADEIGYLAALPRGAFMHLSLGVRGAERRFSAAEYRRIAAFHPLVCELVCRHWTPRDAGATRNALTTQLDSALKLFGRDFLTERETEVMQLLLRGHSTKSAAERLGISPETVKLHRKHSYAKLDVSTQAELFHLFIDALGSYRGGDPLRGYLDRAEPRRSDS